MSSSPTTDELKRLLESGFHIIEISHEFKEGKLTTITKLRKGSSNQVISSENDPVFFDYIKHFKRGLMDIVTMFFYTQTSCRKVMITNLQQTHH